MANDQPFTLYTPECSTKSGYISNIIIKDEIIIPDDPPIGESESTISDSDVFREGKDGSCQICQKYRSMFIILNNHECTYEEGSCELCLEITHWSDCLKKHKESHIRNTDVNDCSSESTVSDVTGEKKCDVCFKYSFMMAVLRRHGCETEGECKNCTEISKWLISYEQHKTSHANEEGYSSEGDGFSDSTASDENDTILEDADAECYICVKYKSMIKNMRNYHRPHFKGSSCKECSEIKNFNMCLKIHESSHSRQDTFTKIDLDSDEPLQSHHAKKNCKICSHFNNNIICLVHKHQCKGVNFCETCDEVSHWKTCLKNHLDLYNREMEDENFSNMVLGLDTSFLTTCQPCVNYVNRIKSFDRSNNCSLKCECKKCKERSYWMKCFVKHAAKHEEQGLIQLEKGSKLLGKESIRNPKKVLLVPRQRKKKEGQQRKKNERQLKWHLNEKERRGERQKKMDKRIEEWQRLAEKNKEETIVHRTRSKTKKMRTVKSQKR